MSVRVAVVDDHESVRSALRTVCADNGYELVADGAAVGELLTALDGRAVDVVVLDLSLGDGVPVRENVERVRGTGARVLVHSIADRVAGVQEAFAAGAAGVVPKAGRPQVLAAAIAAVAVGHVLTNLEWATALDADAVFVREHLDEGERRALAAIASGLPLRAAAESLGLQPAELRGLLDAVRAKYAA